MILIVLYLILVRFSFPTSPIFQLCFAEILSVTNGLHWGDWGTIDYCPAGSFATGYRQNVSSWVLFYINDKKTIFYFTIIMLDVPVSAYILSLYQHDID